MPRATYAKNMAALVARCPQFVEVERWGQAIEDTRRFVARWGEQAQALGWTPCDLFGLGTPLAKPHPSYSRLSRYDETGLIWLLAGRPVVALTAVTAAIQKPPGSITTYSRHEGLPTVMWAMAGSISPLRSGAIVGAGGDD